MTQVDFYHDAPDRLTTALSIVRKAYAQRTPLLLLVPASPLAKRLDHLLWEQPAIGFYPHCRLDSPLASQTPILIAEQLAANTALPHQQLLINLGEEVPAGCERFARIIEIVGRSEADKGPARQRFKHYRDGAYDIHRHDLSGHSS